MNPETEETVDYSPHFEKISTDLESIKGTVIEKEIPGETEEETIQQQVQVITDFDRTEETIIQTDSGTIHVIHEMTLGDVVISSLLGMILIFLLLDRVIRR